MFTAVFFAGMIPSGTQVLVIRAAQRLQFLIGQDQGVRE